MDYIVKQKPEDFKVEEVSDINPKKNGAYVYFWLTKRNYTTEAAIQKLCRYFNIQRKFFGYAGNKDRKAITKQLCSVKGRIRNAEFDDIKVEVFGRGTDPISLGDLVRNKFEIVVRNVDEPPKKIEKIKNYFDSQRFGMKRNNHIIGKAIIKGDFEKSVNLIDNDDVKQHLQNHPNDFIGALRKIPKKILTIYIHAYQSFIWNKCVEQLDANIEVPIVGFGTELKGDVGKIVKNVLKDESVTLNDFVIRQIPELSSEGSSRKVIVNVENLEIGKLEDDELKGKKKVKVCFSLPKGSYATIVIKEMFTS